MWAWLYDLKFGVSVSSTKTFLDIKHHHDGFFFYNLHEVKNSNMMDFLDSDSISNKFGMWSCETEIHNSIINGWSKNMAAINQKTSQRSGLSRKFAVTQVE